MKAIVTLTAGLMIVSATFAQSSRRSEVKENNEDSNNTRRSEQVSSDRRTPSERATNSRTEQTNTNRRNYESNAPERRSESTTTSQGTQQQQQQQERATNSRAEQTNTNRRNYEGNTTERRNESTTSQGVQQQQPSGGQDRSATSVTNRRNGGEQQNNYSSPTQQSTRTYESSRREPSGNQQVIVHDNNRRAEPRHRVVVRESYRPVPVEVRRVKHPYRAPVRTEVIWTVDLSRRFEVYYPHYRPYRYHVGMRLATVSAYDAFDYVGEIARVYGRVSEAYYSWETDEYFLYLGDYYPYHDFSVVIPGREARDFSRRPERFFVRQYIEVTGLITRFEGKPEMVIRRSNQIGVY